MKIQKRALDRSSSSKRSDYANYRRGDWRRNDNIMIYQEEPCHVSSESNTTEFIRKRTIELDELLPRSVQFCCFFMIRRIIQIY